MPDLHLLPSTQQRQYMVAMLGARGYYAVPRILHQAGRLAHFYTDVCATKGLPRYLRLLPDALQPRPIKRLTGRIPNGIPPESITAFSGFGIEYALRLQRATSTSQMVKTFLWAGKTFSQLILQRGLCGEGIYAFNTAALELFQAAKAHGLKTVLEQTIAPYQMERHLLQEEQSLHPGWEEPMDADDAILIQYMEREREEWALADVIRCGSAFVRDSIQYCQTTPSDRTALSANFAIVPYGVDAKFNWSCRSPHDGALRVLSVGSVGLRKGYPYVLEAAKRLQGKAHFRVVGPLLVLPHAIESLQKHVELVGQVPRSQILDHYHWADVFLLPSICEGSATVTYEALACGLPVITTPNAGSLVTHGVNGFIVPIRAVDAIVEAIEQLSTQRELLKTMSQAAADYINPDTFSQFDQQLLQAL